jgi:hypothetical protein
MNPFIWVQDGVLSSDFCQHVIKRFDLDSRSYVGKTSGGYMPDMKRSTDMNISRLDDWKQEDAVFFDALNKYFPKYKKHIDQLLPNIPVFGSPDVKDEGYQIQKTAPGEGYEWHQDGNTKDGYVRALTYIWYLNDVPEGGETEFYDGTLIKPAQGRMLLFPATWTFMHRGKTPASNKYIVTGWMSYKIRLPKE